MDRFFYIANWKMNVTIKESEDFFKDFLSLYISSPNKEVVFCPSFTTLPSAIKSYIDIDKISFGAQNVSNIDSGAYTGEISANMLSDLQVQYCIVGHSERRQNYNESNKLINQKLKILINNNIVPILCVGESLGERELSQSDRVISSQLSQCLYGIEKTNIIVAYEPIWAIGSGKSASAEDISNMNNLIRNCMNKLGYINDQFYILYGGSVGIDNLLSIKEASLLDGFLIGGASLQASTFWKIIDK